MSSSGGMNCCPGEGKQSSHTLIVALLAHQLALPEKVLRIDIMKKQQYDAFPYHYKNGDENGSRVQHC